MSTRDFAAIMSQSSEDSQPFELFNRRSRGDDNNHIGVDEHVENAAEQPAFLRQ